MSHFPTEQPSKDEFSQLVLAEIKRIGTTEEWKPDEREFMLTCRTGRIFLGNPYAEYCQAEGEHRGRILSNLVSHLPTARKEFSLDEARENCVAVVRERALFELSALKAQIQGLGNGADNATEPIKPRSLAVFGGRLAWANLTVGRSTVPKVQKGRY